MNSTIVGLVAAIAVLSGGLGFSMTGVFDDQNLMTTRIPGAGFLMGQVQIEARNADGEIFAYRLSDNEVVDDGEQCILKLLFGGGGDGTTRGGYTSTADTETSRGGCTGALTNAWNVIAIGDGNEVDTPVGIDGQSAGITGFSNAYQTSIAGATVTLAIQDQLTRLGNETSTVGGLERAVGTITWQNGTGDTKTQITLAKQFTNTSPTTIAVGESGLFNSTVIDSPGMLARQTFVDVSLATGDSITVTWTFTVGN